MYVLVRLFVTVDLTAPNVG